MSVQSTEPHGEGKQTETNFTADATSTRPSPPDGEVSVSFNNTLGDTFAFQRYIAVHSPVCWLLTAIVVVLTIPGSFLLQPNELSFQQKVVATLIVVPPALLLLFLLGFVAFVLLICLQWFMTKTRGIRETLTLSEESFKVETALSKSECKWGALRKLRWTRRFAYLFLRPGMALVVPRRAFVAQDDFDAFIGFCEVHADPATLPQQAGSGLLARAIVALRWLTTSPIGAAILAMGGALVIVWGGARIIDTLAGPSAPTRVAVTELEKSKLPPENKYLEITDGHLYWPELYCDALGTKGGEPVVAFWYYVPLVSKDVVKDWTAVPVGAKLPYNNARVFLKISPSDMRRDFPHELDNSTRTILSQEKSPVTGSVGDFKRIPEHMSIGMQRMAKDRNPERMILLHYGDEIPSKPAGVGVGLCMTVFGVVLFVPLGVVVRQRFKRSQPPAAGDPTSPAAPTPEPPRGA
jgi:hypothetical protein